MCLFCFNDTATTEIYTYLHTLSLHDALPILDAFYASVDQRRDPALRGKPVIVGAPGARGVVAAASYEAPVFGIQSAMPSVRAQRLCPHATLVAGDHAHYPAASQTVLALFADYPPPADPIPVHRAFLPSTPHKPLH